MSDIAQVKTLDGQPTTFLRFDGADKYVVDVGGETRTITREEGRRLPSLSARNEVERVPLR